MKRIGRQWLPAEIGQRPKRPNRAPVHRSFFNEHTADYVPDGLSAEKLRQTALFKPAGVGHLVQKIRHGQPVTESGDMALAGILSTQLFRHYFVERFRMPPPLSERDPGKVRIGSGLTQKP